MRGNAKNIPQMNLFRKTIGRKGEKEGERIRESEREIKIIKTLTPIELLYYTFFFLFVSN